MMCLRVPARFRFYYLILFQVVNNKIIIIIIRFMPLLAQATGLGAGVCNRECG